MKKKNLLLAVAASSIAFQAQAQETLEPIIVTADKIPTKAQSVGSSVTVITGKEMAEKNIVYVTDYLKQVPGVALYQNGVRGGVSRVFLRGAEDNQTLVLINGIEVNDPALGGAFDFAHLLAADIEKIEVIRGSQSALWGSDAIGGVINIITKTTPDTKGLSGNYRFEYGDLDSRFAHISTSYGHELTNLVFSLQGERTTGESASELGTEDDGYENLTLDLTSTTNLNDQTVLTLYGRYVTSETEFDGSDFSDPASPTFGRLVDMDNESDTDQVYTKAEIDWTSEDESYQQILGYQYTDTENRFDQGTISEFNSDKDKIYYQLNNFRKLGKGFFEGDYAFTFGYDYEDETYDQVSFTNQNQSFEQHGFVWQAQSDLNNGLTVTGSVRYDENDNFKDEVTYRASSSYKLNDATRFHGSYGTGVKNPGFTELFGFSPDSFIGNPNLRPEKSDSFDIGVENKFFNDRITTDVTYFNIDLEDEIVSTFDPVTFLSGVDNLAEDSERQGVELSLLMNVTDNWFVRSSYTYLDAEGPDGQEELRRPEHIFSVSSDYKFKKGQVGIEVIYTGDSLDNDFSTSPASVQELDDFTIVNISGQYPLTDNLKLTGRVDNLTDEDYQTVVGFNSLGIAAYVGLQGNF